MPRRPKKEDNEDLKRRKFRDRHKKKKEDDPLNPDPRDRHKKKKEDDPSNPYPEKPEEPDVPTEPEGDNDDINVTNYENEYIKNMYKIGYKIDVLNNNYLEFELTYIPLDKFVLQDIIDIKSATKITISSKYPLLLRKWNYINYGITTDKRLFIQIVNEKHPIESAELITSDKQITIPSFALDYFINNIIENENEVVYDQNLKMKEANLDNVYLKFPPIVLGGLENRSEKSQIVQSTKNSLNIPTEIKALRVYPNIDNGLKDFQIGMFRYYNKYLTRQEKIEEYKTKNIKDTDISIKNNCFIDLQFETVDDNKISDESGNANHGILIGDMKFSIYNDGKEFDIVQKDLPTLKNEEGPF